MCCTTTAARAEDASQVLLKNVNVFDGVNGRLASARNVLVEGNVIKTISRRSITVDDEATVVDGGGRTLMPGLIDGHAHIMINDNFGPVERDHDQYDLAIRATVVVKRYLMDGFTTVRDLGGPAFALRRNIDAGMIPGPRIFPSGAFISQTSGHGDFRDRGDAGFTPNAVSDLSNFERYGIGAVADGVAEVLKATRLNLRNGATQIKIMAGGGGSSRFDPIDTTQYSLDEIKAIVGAAEDWGTYACAHVFNDRAVGRLLDGGVRCFEHAFFISDETMARIAAEGGYVVPQFWGISPDMAKNPLIPESKMEMVLSLGEEYSDFGRRLLKNKVQVVFASDYVGAFADAERARRYEIWWSTQQLGSNLETLRSMTSTAGKLMAESGPRNPYQAGKLGVVEEGAYADLLIVDGNPLEDISVIGGSQKWFDADPEWRPIETIRLIMKDGVIHKNTLDGEQARHRTGPARRRAARPVEEPTCSRLYDFGSCACHPSHGGFGS
ncbi:MAG: metal-dependent hydrolase family protein [Planctomycetota bacterium]